MDSPLSSVNFGHANRGIQVNKSNAPIEAHFHYPPDPEEQTPAPYATIGFSRDPSFVERGDLLKRIDSQCSEPSSRVAIWGLGGVGKSQIAIEFSHRLANGNWLLVLDSADDPDVFFTPIRNDQGRNLAEYLPQSTNGSILVTTRNRDLAFRLVGIHNNVHHVGPMTEQESLSLLQNRLGTLGDVSVAPELVASLDFVPLAISQAAAYISRRTPRTSVAKYLAGFKRSKRKRVELLSEDSGNLRRDLRQDGAASNSVLTTWQFSFDHIRAKRSSAADLLFLMSFFNRQGIPESILVSTNYILKKETPGYNDTATLEHDLAPYLESKAGPIFQSNRRNFEKDIEVLRDYSLITQNHEAPIFEMHQLVQLATQRWLQIQWLQQKYLGMYLILIASSFGQFEPSNWANDRELLPHVEAAALYQPNEQDAKQVLSILLCFGVSYAYRCGRPLEGTKMARISIEIMHNLPQLPLQEDPGATLRILSMNSWIFQELANTYRYQHRWKEAEKLDEQVLETLMKKFGVDHPQTVENMLCLAKDFERQGRCEEAERLAKLALEKLQLWCEADHADILRAKSIVALSYKSRGRLKEAEKILLRIVEAQKQKAGDADGGTLVGKGDLAGVYRLQKRFEEAEVLFKEVLEVCLQGYGTQCTNTLVSMTNLAIVYKQQGQLNKAEALLTQAVEGYTTVFGADHIDTIASLERLAEILRLQRRREVVQGIRHQGAQREERFQGEFYWKNSKISFVITMSN
ncbi:tpr domain protein, partial [Fusarium beomiforme]